ncbi:hypothetical protein [Thiobacillus sp. 63-78]|uniref:hypothetical protein n=1 Tax=Thiobacillus sp. 63-78 TaxID=1895859 RepID=UPI000AFE0496|nr:hypothetical protein [Thiobacillus sp. 63-78]MBN8762023.1 hypothetical protein [Thiobacillus sp.]
MPALPVYHVEFIPLERRLGDRRVAPRDAALPLYLAEDRRKVTGRRAEDRRSTPLKAV